MWLTALIFSGGFVYWFGLICADRNTLITGGSVLMVALGVMLVIGNINALAIPLLVTTGLLGYILWHWQARVFLVIGWTVFVVVILALGFRVLPLFTPAETLLTAEHAFRVPPEKVALMLLAPPMILVAWSVSKPGAWRIDRLPGYWVAGLILLATLVMVIPLALLTGFIKLGLTPHSVAFMAYWLMYNLLYTCVLEETFFRGMVQTALIRAGSRRFSSTWAQFAGIGGAAILFGVAHFGGGWTYVMLATLAGFGYGLAYELTGRLHYAVLVHFSVNAVHRLFFAGIDSGL